MKENPCKDCNGRAAGCHSICKYYQQWYAIHKLELEQQRRERENLINYVDHGKKGWK